MKIALLGDIALIGKYDRTLYNDVSNRVSWLSKWAEDCDYVVANLESPLTRKTTTIKCKGVYLRSDPKNVKTLKEIGVTHVTLANNHVYDFGTVGVQETISVLEANGINHIGLNKRPQVIWDTENRIMLEGFCCYSANAINYGLSPMKVNLLTPDSLKSFVKKAYENEALPILSAHYGVENTHYPALEHLKLFREIAAENPFILHGHHPHVPQGYEKINGSLLLYSLGNLCFDTCEVTSIGRPNFLRERNHQFEVAKIEIQHNQIINYQVVELSDADGAPIHPVQADRAVLLDYCDKLKEPYHAIQNARTSEFRSQSGESEPRNFSFYKNRLNRKYVGAFLNGMSHAKKYKSVFAKYIEN